MKKRSYFFTVVIFCVLISICVFGAESAAKIRVACVGDSITYGAGIKDRDVNSYPTQLGRMLGEKWDVRNFGVSGATMLKKGNSPYWNLKAFKDAKTFEPNVVVIKLGTNDSKPDNWKYKSEFTADYEAMIDEFARLASKPKIYVCYPVPAYEVKWGINDTVIKNEIIAFVIKVAIDKKATVIDLYEPLKGKPECFPDRIHPNTEGAHIIAEVISGQISKYAPSDKSNAPPKVLSQLGEKRDTKTFPGTKSQWNGFDKYEFEYDGRKCIVVTPKVVAQGNPWIWRARFFGHQPQTDIALLLRGFHLVYMDVVEMLGSPKAVAHWNAFYKYLTEDYGFAKKVALEGMSRGGLYIYNWAAANPEKVSCIYADAPVCDFKSWPGGKGKSKGNADLWKKCLEEYGLTEEECLSINTIPSIISNRWLRRRFRCCTSAAMRMMSSRWRKTQIYLLNGIKNSAAI